MQTSGAMRREIVDLIFSCHHPRRRVIQYSRDGYD